MRDAGAARRALGFPIVGIGASAGGLEALEQFLSQVPDEPGAAFVIVQHHDPQHKDLLVEAVRRMTRLAVIEAADGTRIEPGRVYVVPPGKNMSLVDGTLRLPAPPPEARALPIDFLFRSLAEDQGERSIGVILSGMGSDGTLGLRAIKEVAGASFVQAPSSATFEAMPTSAIDAGVADAVAPVDELARMVLSYRDHAAVASTEREHQPPAARAAIDQICALLREHSGNDFAQYKRSTIDRRIERRMGLHQIRDHARYLRYLGDHPQEVETLFNELLIGVTSFFRDPGEWDRLRHEILPVLVTQRATGGVLRAWVPGCSTGEEAYSLAIACREVIEPIRVLRNVTVQIFATDLDRHAIDRARVGLYPENIAADVSPERLRRFFVRDERGYRVCKEIRESVVFAPQSILVDPPFTKVDIVSCRNLMIYLSTEVQKRLIPLFHYCLNPGGVLFVGSAETVGNFGHLFAPLDGRTRLYRRLDQPAAPPPRLELSLGRALELHDDRGGPVVPSRPPAHHLQALVDRLRGKRGSRVTVQKLAEPGELAGAVIVVINDAEAAPPARRSRGAARSLEDELQRARDRLQTLREDMQTSQEELEATNEELRSTNEELQSANEELTTSKEEMQSLNEELQTVNHELQSKVDELSRSNNDMKNLLNSTDIATLFLDSELRVRRFTTATAQIIKLILADTGRPVTDIATDLDYRELADDAREVLRSLVSQEKQVVTRDGRAFAVRIMPYRTLDNVIDGVVITFTDTTAVRALEVAAREQANQLRQMAEALPHLVFGARADGGFDFVSPQWVDYTGVPDLEQVHWGWLDQVHAADRDRVRDEWHTAIRARASLDTELRIRNISGSYRWFQARAVPIRDATGAVVRWYGSATDIDQLKRAEDRLAGVLAAIGDGLLAVDRDLAIVAINPAAERMLGRSAGDAVGRGLADAVPALRELADQLRRPEPDPELALPAAGCVARIERGRDGGFVIFLGPASPS